nr:putative disease resistance protein At3g14460 [Malus domestica]
MHTLLLSLQKLEVFDCPEVESYYDGSRGNTTILFPNLRELVLSRCPKLTEIVPLEKLPRLESVQLRDLESFNGSLAHVESECPKFLSLVRLKIEICPNFVCFPDGGMDAPKLEELRISQCKKLRSLPEQMHILLPSLQRLKVFGCPEVESFPQGGLPSNLQGLSFECYRKLAANRSLWGLTRLNSLRNLEISFTEEGGEETGCSFPEEGLLPATLTSLSICFHPNLRTIQGKVLRQLTSLEHLTIQGCPELQGFPEQMHTLIPSLQKLRVFGCPEVESFPQGGLPSNLQDLSFECCRKLAANRSLWGLTRLNSLRRLDISFTEEGGEEMGCSFPEEGLLPATLTSLSIRFLPNLTTIQGKVLRQLTSLEDLTIRRCPELQGFPEEAPKSLKSLTIWECPNIGWRDGCAQIGGAAYLSMEEIEVVARTNAYPSTVAVNRLSIYNLPNLTTIQGKVLRQLTSLENLIIDGCPELQCFLEEAPKSLKGLTITRCPKLGCLPGEWLPTSLSYLQIHLCPLLEQRFQRDGGRLAQGCSHPRVYIL